MPVVNITVEVDRFGSFEAAVRRFRKRVERTGLITDILKHNQYEKPSDKRRRKENDRKRQQKFLELKAKGGSRARKTKPRTTVLDAIG